VRARDQGAAIWNQDHLGDEEQQHLAEIPEEGDMLHQQQMAASVFAAASAQRLSGDGSSLAQQMQLDSVAGAAVRRTTPPCSPGTLTQGRVGSAEHLRAVRICPCADSCCCVHIAKHQGEEEASAQASYLPYQSSLSMTLRKLILG
jgi:hypothetical protein